MEAKKRITPSKIFCPKCGSEILIEEITNLLELKQLNERGYIGGANGKCKCGIILALVVQEMPKSPTFTLMFDIYEIKQKEVK